MPIKANVSQELELEQDKVEYFQFWIFNPIERRLKNLSRHR